MRYYTVWLLTFVTVLSVRLTYAPPRGIYDPMGCPDVKVSCADSDPLTPLTFSATVSGAAPYNELSFKWTVTAGVITSGQGTASITVNTSEASGRAVTATVVVGGPPSECFNKASCSTAVIRDPAPQKIDEYGGVSIVGESARLDRMAAQMRKNPDAQGYILSYAGRRARVGEAQWRAERAKRYLVMKWGFDLTRIVVIDGGHKETHVMELYIVPSGVIPPAVSPTVEPREVEIIGRRRKRHVRP